MNDPSGLSRQALAGIEPCSIQLILIFAIARNVSVCFHKIAGIIGIVLSDPAILAIIWKPGFSQISCLPFKEFLLQNAQAYCLVFKRTF